MKDVKMKGHHPLPEEDYGEEKFCIDFDLRYEILTDEHKELLHRYFDWEENDRPTQDEVIANNYTFEFDIEYFNLVNTLEFIIRLYDEGIMYRVETKELIKGRCLIQDLICRLEKLEKKFGELK